MFNISGDLDFVPYKQGDQMADDNKEQIKKLGEFVNSPKHYNQGSIEVIDFIEDIGMGEDFCAGNAIKYLSRYKFKQNPLEDLKKSKWYIERLIKQYENK